MPDMYLDELQEMLVVTQGVQVSKSTIWRRLKAGGFTLKKVCHIIQDTTTNLSNAAERSAEKRLEYFVRISQYTASQLIFVDESSVDRRTTYRGRAWSIRGTAAQRKAFFV
jgi:hypothetical protein